MSAVETIDLIDDDDDVNDSSTSHAVSASAPVYEVIDSDEEPKPAAKQSATKRTKAKKRKTSEPSSSSSSGSSSSSSSSSSAASASSTAASVTTSANKEPDKAKKKPKTDDEKRVARLKKEYDSLQKERANLPNIDARPNDSAGKKKAVDDDTSFDWQNWTAELIGPDGTPYAGAIFKMTLKYPSDYPFKPPSVHFSTPIFHPNFSADGHICLDILQNAWSPALNTTKLLLSISSLLEDPNTASPLNSQAAGLYNQKSKAAFDREVKKWIKQHCETVKSTKKPKKTRGS